jgi:hypothetical protein
MKKRPSDEEVLADIRRAYVLAKALNVQYQFIREYINPDLIKVINNAKSANSFFIKKIDQAFSKRRLEDQLEKEEELAFRLLEELEKEDVNHTNTPAGETQ